MNAALPGRTNCASHWRGAQAAFTASAMSGRKVCSAFIHTEARSTNMPLFQK